eukprot:TRINITY_DN7708_c0_g1_i3.p1 TRINITY_DN7708_c0_g1~~TRINITY_DN7708_c0_g1_i3.p1  ORF type:complete len:161 (+),score=31.67 TRINITY_DN7708_c0_g1_i3:44-526(+)
MKSYKALPQQDDSDSNDEGKSFLQPSNGVNVSSPVQTPTNSIHYTEGMKFRDEVKNKASSTMMSFILGAFFFFPLLISIGFSFYMANNNMLRFHKFKIVTLAVLELLLYSIAIFLWFFIGPITTLVWPIAALSLGIPRIILTNQNTYFTPQECGEQLAIS